MPENRDEVPCHAQQEHGRTRLCRLPRRRIIKGMIQIATFADGSVLSTFGKRDYELFADRVVVCGGRWGEKFETTILLDELRREPERLLRHSQMFRFGVLLSASTLLLLLVTSIIFGNFAGKFTAWYAAGSLLVILGVLGCITSFRRIHMTRFLNKSGVPSLAVIAQHKAKRQEQEAFVLAIQKQLAERRGVE